MAISSTIEISISVRLKHKSNDSVSYISLCIGTTSVSVEFSSLNLTEYSIGICAKENPGDSSNRNVSERVIAEIDSVNL